MLVLCLSIKNSCYKQKKLNPKYLCMIIPLRLYSGGRGLDSFHSEMMEDTYITEIYDYSNSDECCAGVDISGGICYFL